MSEKMPILNKETLIPMGVAAVVLIAILGVASFAIAQAADIRILREWQISSTAADVDMQGRVQSIELAQGKIDTKLDYLLRSIDAISKKLDIIP